MIVKTINCSIEQMEIEHSSCFGGACPMTKIAGEDHLSKINQKKDHAYLHVIAMGAGDYYGENSNGDFFYEKDLKNYYKTFETAGVFIQHFNKDPSKSIGKVLKAIYNDDMHRVELIIEISKKKAPDIYGAIARGERMKVSMGVKVPQEMCSYCGAITKGSIANRCDHLKYEMHQQKPNGQIVYAINLPPMNFFDISIVRKPADAQGYALFQKVASVQETPKYNLEEKVAELVKRIDAINALPASIDVDEMDRFRKSFSPDTIIRIIRSKNIMLKPSEAMFVGTNIDKDEFPNCEKYCDNEGFIRILLDKLINQPPCDFIKQASPLKYSNPFIRKLEARNILVKEAMKHTSDINFFGDAKRARPADIARRAFKNHDFAQYKINFIDGKSVTVGRKGFGINSELPSYYLDLVDKGFAHNITGIRVNGDETVVYQGPVI